MKPFDEVTFDIKQGDITYTYGGTVVSIYDDEESEEMKPVPEAYSKMTITITDGKCTFGSDEYTRQ